MSQSEKKNLSEPNANSADRTSPEQVDTDPRLSKATSREHFLDKDIDSLNEDSAEISGVMSLLSRVRSQAPEQLMFSGSSISSIQRTISRDIPELPLPERIGRFEIKRLIGEGGYGQVLLAWDPRLEREIALKIPRAQTLLTRELRRRFIQEATAAASLSHPNIVTVFEAGREEELYFIASRFCPGLSLAGWLKRYPEMISLRQKAELISVLAGAVHHAHKRNILHRDLKPANVLIESADDFEIGSQPDFDPHRARITDFGLALVTSNEQNDTKSGSILGTPAYISPEQSQGKTVGPATDIYALGIVLYETLTGKTPFQREQIFDTLQAARNEEPKRPSKIKSDIPQDLEAICLKCLEKDPAKRYESAFELKLDLARYLDGVPVRARRVSRMERFARVCKRNPALSFATTAVAMLVLCLAVGSSYAAFVFAQKNQESLDHLEEAIMARDKATQNETLAIQALFEARFSEAQGHRRSPYESARSLALSSIDKAVPHVERLGLRGESLNKIRNETIAAISMVGLELEKKWPGIGQRSTQVRVAFDAEAKRYARMESDKITIRSMEDNRILQTLPGFGSSRSGQRPFLKFSSQGTYLAVRGKHGKKRLVQVWKLDDTSKPVLEESTGKSIVREAVEFSPNERFVAYGVDRRIVVRDLSSLNTISEIETENDVSNIHIDPTNSRIATSVDRASQTLRIYSLSTGSAVGPAISHAATICSVAWHPNARWLATGTNRGDLAMWDTRSGRLVTEFHGLRNSILSVAFNRRGTLLMSSGWDSTTRLWEHISGQQLVKTIERGVSFSEDDTKLTMAVAGSMIGRWNVSQGESTFFLPVEASNPAFGPQNRILALRTAAGIELWDIENRKRLATIPGIFHSATFRADGSSLMVSSRGQRKITAWEFPLEWSGDGTSVVVGEPRQFLLGSSHDGHSHASFSTRSSMVTAELTSNAITVMDLSKASDDREVAHLPGAKQRHHVISGDGTFAATGSWKGEMPRIWKTNGELIREFDFPGNAEVAISPDDRWVAIMTLDRATIVDTSNWKNHYELPFRPFAYARASFSADGRVAAIATGKEIVILEVPAKKVLGRVIPSIETTYGDLTLSPSGRWLVIAEKSNGPVQCWDPSRLRKQLADRKIDWEDEDLFARNAFVKPPAPLQVAVTGASAREPVDPGLENIIRAKADLAELNRELGRFPKDPIKALKRGRLSSELERFEDSIRDFDMVIQSDPRLAPDAMFERGLANARKPDNNWDAAIADISEVASKKKDSSLISFELAWLLVTGDSEKKDAERALEILNNFKPNGSSHWQYHTIRGSALLEQKQYEKAIAEFKKAHRSARFATPLHLLKLAECHHRLDQVEKANIAFNAAIQWWSLIAAERPQWREREFLRQVELAKANYADDYKIDVPRYVKTREREEHLDELRKGESLIKAGPTNWRGFDERIKGVTGLGMYTASLPDCDVVEELAPNRHSSFYWRACAMMQRGNFESSVKNFRESLRIHPEDYWPHRRLAELLIAGPKNIRDLEAGRGHAEMALHFEPNSRFIQDMLGAVLSQQGKHREAIAVFERKIRKVDLPCYREFYSAQSWQELGEKWKAVQALNRALLPEAGYPFDQRHDFFLEETAAIVEPPTIESSSDHPGSFEAIRAFDGLPDSRWNSKKGDDSGAWLSVTWKKPGTISAVRIEQAYDRITGFRIQGLDDDGTWKDAFVAEGDAFKELRGDKPWLGYNAPDHDPVFEFDLPDRLTAKSVRILITGTVEMSEGKSVSIRDVDFKLE
jgi:serine/threonine protein kinase/WD40 repeat protein/predicted Zn-dependent protease